MGKADVWHRRGKIFRKLKPYLFFPWGFGLGPVSDISHTSPSGGVKSCFLLLGNTDMRFGLFPYFALGPITDVSSPASSGGDSFIIGMNDVDGWFNVRGPEISDVGVSTPSCRVPGSVTTTGHAYSQGVKLSATPLRSVWKWEGITHE